WGVGGGVRGGSGGLGGGFRRPGPGGAPGRGVPGGRRRLFGGGLRSRGGPIPSGLPERQYTGFPCSERVRPASTHEGLQPCGLLLELPPGRSRDRYEWLETDPAAGEDPGSRDESVDEERLRDIAAVDHPSPMLVGHH